jgi:hypothetical protein
MKGTRIEYSDAELFWIADNATRPRREAHAEFVYVWDRPDVSLTNFNSLCKRKGWFTGRTGCFEKGQVPQNKGKKMPFHPNSAKTQFKKGGRSGRAQALYKPIGTERMTKDGYVERKIHDGLPLQSRWRAVHLIRWEERHGPVPEDHCLKCLDSNKANTDPDNWMAIPRTLLPRLNSRWKPLRYEEAEPELKPFLLAVARLEQAASEKKKEKSQ